MRMNLGTDDLMSNSMSESQMGHDKREGREGREDGQREGLGEDDDCLDSLKEVMSR